jgi:DNA polymerase elongation subunit (family B)
MNFYTNVAPWGNHILVREYKNGERVNRKVKYSPTLYVPVQKETEWKTLDGKYASPYKFDTIKEAKAFVEQYKQQPHLVFGLDRFAYTYLSDTYPNTVNWDSDKILTVTIDIETRADNGFPEPELANEEMLAITIKNQTTKKIVVWGLGEFQNDRDDVTYINCSNENELLANFMNFWTKHYPDVVTGWNTEFFDIPYLINRVTKVLGEDRAKEFSPWGLISSRKVYNHGREQQVYDITGVANLDYLQLYRKFTYTNQESYALNHIAFVELGQQKNENPYETFQDWYTKDYQSFLEYNIVDVELVDRLEDKMKLLELCLTMAYEAKVNYEDVFGQVKYWDVLIHNYLKNKKIVIPQKSHQSKSDKYEGAYVKDPQVGQHKWVMSFDLNSLYPHLIMQYNMSPETLVTGEYMKLTVDNMLQETKLDIPEKTTITPNGALYRTDKLGFLPEMMQDIYNDRTVYKKKMLKAKQDYEDTKDPKYLKFISRYNNIQMARKISLNSAYGAIGNQYFRYYDLAIAEGITTAGQLSIRWIEKKINQYLNKLLGTTNEDFVIASDTDSIYVTFDKLVNRVFKEGEDLQKIVNFLDTIAQEKIEPFIDKSYQALSTYVNAYDQKMQMKREVIADKGIWTAKKRYILNAWDVEGVRFKEPQLKIMGIEAVKSSTPAPCRAKIKEALKIIMSGSEKELNDFLIEFRKKFDELPPEEIAYPRSVNGVKKFYSDSSIYRKGTPMHIKGALVYNHMIRERKLTRKYPTIQNGDKIKYLELRQPNPLGCNVISFPAKLPKELDIYKYIDYDSQYEKSFIDPLSFITNNIGWKIDRSFGTQTTLEDFFL